jgi:hypothetical protein
MDVGATLLYSLGLDVPADFEGQVPRSMFSADWLDAHPIVVSSEATKSTVGDQVADSMGDDDKAKIMAQLQLLGYME